MRLVCLRERERERQSKRGKYNDMSTRTYAVCLSLSHRQTQKLCPVHELCFGERETYEKEKLITESH